MRFEASDHAERSVWDAAVADLGGSVFHTTAWADYIVAGEPHAVPVYVSLLADDGGRAGAALGFRLRSGHRLLASLTGRLRTDALPVVKDGDPERFVEFVTALEAAARDAGDVELVLGSFASPGGAEALERLGFSTTPRMEFEIDLRPSEDELWKALEYKRRKNIKKAARLNVALEDLPLEDGIAHLRRLQGASAERIVERGGPDISRASSGSRDPIAALVQAGVGRLIGARVDGEIVSASLFTCFNGLVYHTLSGHDRQALKAQAPTFLLWETIKRYRAKGALRLNMGGCSSGAVREDSAEHGVYEYKKAFGGACLACTSGRKVLRPGAHKVMRTARTLLGR